MRREWATPYGCRSFRDVVARLGGSVDKGLTPPQEGKRA